jgi:cell shape-determining protein MreD
MGRKRGHGDQSRPRVAGLTASGYQLFFEMQNLAIVIFGYVLLVIQTTLATLIPIQAMGPNLILPITLYLGVSQEIHIVRGAILSFILGYLLDSFSGYPIGLQTFVMTSAFMVARGAGLRLLLRGAAFQILMAFTVSLVAGVTTLALPAIFEGLTPLGTYGQTLLILLSSATVTALLTPLIFVAIRKIRGWSGQRDEGSKTA